MSALHLTAQVYVKRTFAGVWQVKEATTQQLIDFFHRPPTMRYSADTKGTLRVEAHGMDAAGDKISTTVLLIDTRVKTVTAWRVDNDPM